MLFSACEKVFVLNLLQNNTQQNPGARLSNPNADDQDPVMTHAPYEPRFSEFWK